MLKYTNMFLIKILAALLMFSFSFNKGLNAKTILATYDISWNSIVLGNIYWEFSVFEKSYNFSIKLESSGLSSKLYPFNGTYSSSGIKTAGGSFSPEKYYHFWRGKKKEKLIKFTDTNSHPFRYQINLGSFIKEFLIWLLMITFLYLVNIQEIKI